MVWVTAEREGANLRTVNGLFEWKEYISALGPLTVLHVHTLANVSPADKHTIHMCIQ